MLYTKFNIPKLQNNIIEKSNALKKLDGIVSRRLAFISSISGFGKTSLVVSWITQKKIDYSWVTLNKDDNDIIEFFKTICIALEGFNINSTEILNLINIEQKTDNINSFLDLIINSLAKLDTDLFIVLDNYNLILDEKIHRTVEYLIKNMSSNIHFLIISRFMCPFNITKLKLQDELIEITYLDLKFNLNEITSLLNKKLNLNIANSNLLDLEEQTNGWIAAIKIWSEYNINSDKPNNIFHIFNIKNKYLTQYFEEEVLQSIDFDLIPLIYKISALENIDAEILSLIADAKFNSNVLLHKLEYFNLFSTTDFIDFNNYKFIEPLKEILYNKLLEILSLEELNDLYINFSDYYEKKGDYALALLYSTKAKNFENNLRLIETFQARIMDKNNFLTLIEAIEELPKTLLASSPSTCITYLFSASVIQKYASAQSYLNKLGIFLEDKKFNPYKGEIYLIYSNNRLNFADFNGTIDFAKKALETLISEHPLRGIAEINLGSSYLCLGELKNSQDFFDSAMKNLRKYTNMPEYLLMICANRLSDIKVIQGKLFDALSLNFNNLETLNKMNFSASIISSIYLNIAKIYYEVNEIDLSRFYLDKSIEHKNSDSSSSNLLDNYVLLSKILISENKFTEAIDNIINVINIIKKNPLPPITILHDIVRILIILKETKLAKDLIEKVNKKLFTSFEFLYESKNIATAEILILDKNYDSALTIVERLLLNSIENGRANSILNLNILKALIFKFKGKHSEAFKYLSEALSFGAKESYINIFINYGIPLKELLIEFMQQNHTLYENVSSYVIKLLGLFNDDKAFTALSDRETEVLKYLSAGLANQEIADIMFVSLSTIKKHANNIYGKLNVKNRTQAIELGRKLKIIE